MTTVLLADRDGRALGPLAEKTVPALLPVRGAPILERALEALVSAGIRSALVVVGPRGPEIERRFGKGIGWGIALEYVRREEEETTGAVLRRLEHRLDGDTLVLRGDTAVEEAFGEFVRRLPGRPEPVVAAVASDRLLGLWRIRPEALKKVELPRDPADADWVRGRDWAALDVGLDVEPLDGLPRWKAFDRGDGTPAVSPRAAVAGGAKLAGGTTVAEEAVVAAKAALDGVSVLPRTVVPEGVALSGVAVAQNLVVDPAGSGTSLLTDLLPPPGAPRGDGIGSRLAGLALFLLTLPATARRRGPGGKSTPSGSRRRFPSSATCPSSSRSSGEASPSPGSPRSRRRRRRPRRSRGWRRAARRPSGSSPAPG